MVESPRDDLGEVLSVIQRVDREAASLQDIPAHWPAELRTLLSSATDVAASPANIRIQSFNASIRFRYAVEVGGGPKKKQTDLHAVLEVDNVHGRAMIVCELLTDVTLRRPRVNTFYLGSHDQWRLWPDGSLLTRELTTVDGRAVVPIPSVGIFRKKEIDLPAADRRVVKTHSVVIVFHVFGLDWASHAEVTSDPVTCRHVAANNGKMAIVHVNPKKGHFKGRTTVIVLTENMTRDCSVVVENEKTGLCTPAFILKRHTENSAALVIMPEGEGEGWVNVRLRDDRSGQMSDAVKFLYTGDPKISNIPADVDVQRLTQQRQLTDEERLLISEGLNISQPSTSQPRSTMTPQDFFLKHPEIAEMLKKCPYEDIWKLADRLQLANSSLLRKATHGKAADLLMKLCWKERVSREAFLIALGECGLVEVVDLVNRLPL